MEYHIWQYMGCMMIMMVEFQWTCSNVVFDNGSHLKKILAQQNIIWAQRPVNDEPLGVELLVSPDQCNRHREYYTMLYIVF